LSFETKLDWVNSDDASGATDKGLGIYPSKMPNENWKMDYPPPPNLRRRQLTLATQAWVQNDK
jgi:hypothetical protein